MGLDVKPEDMDYKRLTPLEAEMRICAEYLHCTHLEFESFPIEEKLKWFLYEEKQIERQKQHETERKLKQLEKEGRGK